jgi:hypothetical protein
MSIFRRPGTSHRYSFKVLGAHYGSHPQAGGMVVKIMTDIGIPYQMLPGGTYGRYPEILVIQFLPHFLSQKLLCFQV